MSNSFRTMAPPKIQAWLEKYKADVERNSAKKWPDCKLNHDTLEWTVGPKYIKVIERPIDGRPGGSVHCFIDVDGNIYKAAGRNQPAKGVRYNIKDVDTSDFDGGTAWLYMDCIKTKKKDADKKVNPKHDIIVADSNGKELFSFAKYETYKEWEDSLKSFEYRLYQVTFNKGELYEDL